MLYNSILATAGLLNCIVLAAPSPTADDALAQNICYNGETTAKLCYTASKNTP